VVDLQHESNAEQTLCPAKKETRWSGSECSAASKDSLMEMSSKEAAFIREHWPVEGRAERIARAE
jgi:hypothetical protein